MPPASGSSTIYQLKITLKGSRPPIWRRVCVPADISLARLHRIIQVTMGWWDAHLHQFTIGRTEYGVPDPDYRDDVRSERTAKLGGLVTGPRMKFLYEYDFGDGWDHEILVERSVPSEPEVRYPVCVAGKRACPPEDVGGVWGYAHFLEAIGDPNHPEHVDLLEWIGGSFDPEAFDLAGTNAQLRRIR